MITSQGVFYKGVGMVNIMKAGYHRGCVLALDAAAAWPYDWHALLQRQALTVWLRTV